MTTVPFRPALRSYLLGNSELTNLVGQDGVYSAVLPDKPGLPAVVYNIITNIQGFAHDGPIELSNPRVQIDVWARRQTEAEEVANAIVRMMVGYSGPMGDISYTAGWALLTETDMYDDESKLRRVSLDFRGWYAVEEALS